METLTDFFEFFLLNSDGTQTLKTYFITSCPIHRNFILRAKLNTKTFLRFGGGGGGGALATGSVKVECLPPEREVKMVIDILS